MCINTLDKIAVVVIVLLNAVGFCPEASVEISRT